MDVLKCVWVRCLVVPHREHSAKDVWIVIFELLLIKYAGLPILVEPRRVEELVVVTGEGDDLEISVLGVDEVIAVFNRFLWIMVAGVPEADNDIAIDAI